MVLGLGLGTPAALAGSVFYLLHHIVVKANLFFVGGVMNRLGGSFELGRLGGLAARGWVAAAFFVPAFSLAGFPPLSGFWAKMLLIRASLDLDRPLVAGAAAAVGLLTVYSMTKIWNEAFWKPAPDAAPPPAAEAAVSAWLLAPSAVLALVTVVLGLAPEPFMDFAFRAAAERAIADLARRRSDLRAELEARGGVRLIVETAPEAQPLRLGRFDPINLFVLGNGQVAHANFISLSDSNGSVQLTNPDFAWGSFGGVVGLTESSGRRPLGDGTRRLTVFGIQGQPKVERKDGTVTIEAPGVRLDWKGAEVETEGATIRVKING